MINKIIIKILGNDFISRSLIGDALVRARESEAARINCIRDTEERQKIENLTIEHEIEIEELRAEIKRLEDILDDQAKKARDTDALYYSNLKYAKRNALITAEMEHKGERILNNIAGFISDIKQIGNKALINVKQIEDKK